MTGQGGDVLLRTDSALRRFGGLVAVNAVSFELLQGQVTGLIGPNGAGKSTMFDLITGMRPLTSGEIYFRGERVTKAPPHTRSPMGMARTFQIVRAFHGLTVLENVLLGLHPKFPDGVVKTLLAGRSRVALEHTARADAMELLEFVGLAHRATERVGHLNSRAAAAGRHRARAGQQAGATDDGRASRWPERCRNRQSRGHDHAA